jgi:hypothetical protein
VLVWGLIVLALVVLIVASLTVWVRRQALNTDAWTKTSSSLLQDEQIRAALAVYLVDQLYARGDIEGRLAANLPAGLQGLAAPFAGAIRGPAQQTAEAFLGRPRVQTAWEDANRLAHERLLAVLNGHPRDNVSTANGDVTLDLRPMVVSVGGEMGLGQALDSSLPADAGQITILKSNELKNAQRAVKGVKALSWVFGVAAFVLWGLALWFAAGWRRAALRGIGASLLAGGLLLLLVRQLAGNYVVDALTTPGTTRDAGHQAWLLGSTLLAEIGWAGILYGVAVLIATTLAGPSRSAVAARSHLTPFVLDHPVVAWLAVGVGFLLLVWWAPTPAFNSLLGILVLAALVALGFIALRRQLVSERHHEPVRVAVPPAAAPA